MTEAKDIAERHLQFAEKFKRPQSQATEVAEWLDAKGEHRDGVTILARAVIEQDAEIQRLRALQSVAEEVRRGRYSIRSKLTAADRTLLDRFNCTVDAARKAGT